MVFHSIRWRLQLWHGLILFAVLTGFGFTAYRLQHANELYRVDQELQHRLGPVLEALRRPTNAERGGLAGPGGPDGARAGPSGSGGPRRPGDPNRPGEPRPVEGAFGDRGRRGPPPRESAGEFPYPREFRLGPNRAVLFESDANSFYYVVWLRDGRELSRSTTATSNVSRPDHVSGSRPVPTIRMRGTNRELYQFTPPGDCILVGRSLAPELANLRQLALVLSGLGCAVLVLGLAGGWWLATRAIRPIHDISAAAATIAGGDFSHRINTDNTDNELGQLAAVLNSTFARLEGAFARQQRFTADASHELRTPIAVILSQTQATLARERNSTEYRETLEACQRAAQRMRRLTESLLALARLDAGHETMKWNRFDLSHTARDAIELLRPLAEDRHITIQCELPSTECFGDADRLAQVITNLVSNAILHNKKDGEVRVSIRRENDSALLVVTDTGPGIPAEDRPRIFERFYRTDKSRTATTGGIGLGLAICKAIVDAHDGSLDVSSPAGSGATFTVRLAAIPCEA